MKIETSAQRHVQVSTRERSCHQRTTEPSATARNSATWRLCETRQGRTHSTHEGERERHYAKVTLEVASHGNSNWRSNTTTHSETRRRKIEALLRGDSAGSARQAAADDRINQALADAVERHATNDGGTRGILNRASVVCHAESRKEIAAPQPSVSNGRSSGSGARPSVTTPGWWTREGSVR